MNAALSGFPAWYFGEGNERRWLAEAIVCHCGVFVSKNFPGNGKWSFWKTATCFLTELMLPICRGLICRMYEAAPEARAPAQPFHLKSVWLFEGENMLSLEKQICASAKQLLPADCSRRATKHLFIRFIRSPDRFLANIFDSFFLIN